jgi:hypothetical protein
MASERKILNGDGGEITIIGNSMLLRLITQITGEKSQQDGNYLIFKCFFISGARVLRKAIWQL